MKIRNGFVSNSSSSSFIVLFPKKPKNVEETKEILFPGEEKGIISSYTDMGLTYDEVANILFSSINTIEPIKNHKELVRDFIRRYDYEPANSHCKHMYAEVDELGGQWYMNENKDIPFGTDKKLLIKIRNKIIELENKQNEAQNTIFKIREKTNEKFGNVPFACKDRKEKYTKKQIKDYEDYNKKVEKSLKNNKEYQKLEKNRGELFNETYEEKSELYQLKKKLALKDMKVFFDKYKSDFLFKIEYSDNDGDSFSVMEHGNIFRNVPHMRISNH